MKMRSEIRFNQQYFGGNTVKVERILAPFGKEVGVQ